MVASEAFKAPVRRTLRERTMLREHPTDQRLCWCPAEAAKVQGQWSCPERARPAAGASFRRPMEAGALRYSVHPAWPFHFRQFELRALRVFSLRSVRPLSPAAAQHHRIWRVIDRSVSSAAVSCLALNNHVCDFMQTARTAAKALQ